MRAAYLVVIYLSLTWLATACQVLTPAPIPVLPDQPPVRPGPLPTSQARGVNPSPAPGPTTQRPNQDNVVDGVRPLVVALPREPLSLDPGDVADPVGLFALRQVYDTLFQYKEGSAEVEPGLATHWEANADATEWTISLRSGVKFHDGTPLTAEAVKFNVDRWLEPGFKAGNRSQGKQFQVWSDIFGGYRGAGSLITDVEVVASGEGGKVRLRTSRPAAYVPAYLALPYFGLSSPTAVESLGGRYGTPYETGVGAGPYRVAAWQNDRLVLERFSDYWGEAPASERVVFRAIGEAEALLAALANGQVDLAPLLSIDRLSSEPGGIAIVPRPSLAVIHLSFNQRYRPLNDVRVRQAIASAVDRPGLIGPARSGAGAPADQFLPLGLWGRLPSQTANLDLSRARSLLAEAGLASGLNEVAGPDGVARPLELWYSQPPRGQSLTAIAQTLATQLNAIGIKVVLREDEWASFLADRRQGRFPLYLMVYPIPSARVEAVGDPHPFFNGLFGPLTGSETGYSNSQLVDWLREAEAAAEITQRQVLYLKAAETLRTDLPRIPLVYPTGLTAVRRAITGYVPSPVSAESLARVRLSE